MAWLLTWIVQSVALGAVTAVLVRLPGFRVRASARAAAWSVALAGTALLACVPLLSWPAADAAGLAAAGLPAGPAEARALLVLPVIPGAWLTAGLVIWVTGAVVWMAWAMREVARVVRLKRDSVPWTADEQRRVAAWAGPVLRERGASLVWCDGLDGPALLGFRYPLIALPRLHGARLTDEELQHVLLHEAAHLRRRDDWAALVELTAAGLLWINPVVHVARRGLGVAREMACDDWVVRQTSAPVAYARCLTAVADLQRTPRRSSLAAAATSTRSILTRRVTRVLDAGQRPGARAAQIFALLTPVAVGVLAIALIQSPPLMIDGHIDAASTPSDREPLPSDAITTQAPATTLASPRPSGAVRAAQAAVDQTPPVRPEAPATDSSSLPNLRRETGVTADASETTPPLLASPVPGAGLPGVPVAVRTSASAESMVPGDNTPWWGRGARVASATGDGATTAGQKTASFFKRLGSSVSQTLTR